MDEKKEIENLSEACFKNYIDIIHKFTGITISSSRKNMVEGRLQKRILELGFKKYSTYLDYLTDEALEKNIFINLITTNETYFFRTPRVWEYLQNFFIPQWYHDHPNQKMQIWSAAASSGEEAYSVIMVCEEFRKSNTGFSFEVLGTDISEEMILKCKKSKYSGRSIDILSKNKPEYLKKYFTTHDNKIFEPILGIKNHVRFEHQNIFESIKIKKNFDLVLIRNMLIYFSQQDQEKVLKIIHEKMNPHSLLIIGESESITHIKNDFEYVEPMIYKKK